MQMLHCPQCMQGIRLSKSSDPTPQVAIYVDVSATNPVGKFASVATPARKTCSAVACLCMVDPGHRQL